jgi:hypothetical protein
LSDYDTDILIWSERQGELLRRRAAGELVNEAELDWPNIAEEIEDVGRSQLHAVESLLATVAGAAWPGRASDDGLGVSSMIADNI